VTRYLTNGFCSALAAGLIVICTPAATAQDSTSREVVQPLPSAQVQRLNRALLELARRPNSVAALREAGDASLAVDDLDAAIGFYGSAAEVDPSDARVKLGLARVYLRSGRPVEALPLLAEAESAGAQLRDVISARALAYDLVGDQKAAQTAYATALELTPQDDEARRRFAISQAISGNATGFQETLAPLIEARDVAAFRARAFGLAILGEQERAEGIVNSIMPRDLSARINPYLAYMPRLTPAQQAAAANLGVFPRAADIGREDPRIARFASESESGSLLEPAGEPLGAPVAVVQEAAEVAASSPLEEEGSAPIVAEASASETYGPVDAPGDEAASLPSVATREVETAPVTKEPQLASVADAFADMNSADLPTAEATRDAVDIAAIEVPREVEPEPEPAPEPVRPEHPRRIWVQLATGRDVSALGFDWRRLSRRAGGLLEGFEPHVTPWGQANRLLAGPVDSSAEARRLVNALGEKGLETFTYTSPEGTEIQVLN